MSVDVPLSDPFRDLDAYVQLPRLGGLWLSPDGRRLVVGVATPDRENSRYTSALWVVDPDGERPARRLTRSGKGEVAAAFTPAGDLLFTSARPEPDGSDDQEPRAALWLQPAGGGDARVIAKPAGGVSGVVVSRTGTIALGSALLPSSAGPEAEPEDGPERSPDDGPESSPQDGPESGAESGAGAGATTAGTGTGGAAVGGSVQSLAGGLEGGHDADREARKRRKDAGVSAILHEEYPVRFWDHDLGPDRVRLLTADLTDDVVLGDAGLGLRDRSGHVGRALGVDSDWDISPDGRTVVAAWTVAERGGSQRVTLMAIDTATGDRRVLADDPGHEYDSPRISPDGTRVALVVRRRSSLDDPGDNWLALVPLAGGAIQDLTDGWDRWPEGARWTPDGAALIVAADDRGRSPLWRVDAATGEVTRLTHDDGAYTDIRVSPGGRWVYALRNAVDSPPSPVRVPVDGAAAPDQLRGPGAVLAVPGELTEVEAIAADGSPLRAWLAVPDGAADSPAPLLLWIHGGPLGSWNAWSWRWNPWLAVAQGYAVLLPDPAISTGYGYEFVKRGWGAWGDAPFTDLMALTDAAEARPDIDAGRTAAMGGSFGGYMANWIAGHTDRFAAIVTHASLWSLDQMMTTTDAPFYWARELTPDRLVSNSPHRSADAITTPMLVIHGDRDYRVPIGEALRLWWDLLSRSTEDDGSSRHKFLYFPDENHWILKPGNATIWYETVFAFLAHHVRGEKWQRPELLG